MFLDSVQSSAHEKKDKKVKQKLRKVTSETGGGWRRDEGLPLGRGVKPQPSQHQDDQRWHRNDITGC